MKSANATIDRPVFLIGSGRSGTTILYHVLCGHPRLAWFSNYNERWPQLPGVASCSWLYTLPQLQRWRGKGLPVPAEAYAVWDLARPVLDSPCDPRLDETHATPEEIARTRHLVAANLKHHGKTRFVNKNTRNTRRLRYLQRIFEDAIFIHVLRDPRAAIASLLNVEWWPTMKVWCHNQITAQAWAAQGRDPALLAAHLWATEVRCVLEDKQALAPDQYLEVRYEAFINQPQRTLRQVLEFCDLRWTSGFERFVESFALKSMNDKFKKQFTPAQLAQLAQLVAPLARQLGYELEEKSPAALVNESSIAAAMSS